MTKHQHQPTGKRVRRPKRKGPTPAQIEAACRHIREEGFTDAKGNFWPAWNRARQRSRAVGMEHQAVLQLYSKHCRRGATGSFTIEAHLL